MQQFVDYFLKNLYTIFYIYSQIHHAMTKIILKRPLLESEKAVLEKTAIKELVEFVGTMPYGMKWLDAMQSILT